MKKSFCGAMLLVLLFLSVNSVGQDYFSNGYDVPYVPTRYEVVDEMLKMADVKADDILYDLGCGDGRIVITAAEKIGSRGIGIDINPVRIEESEEKAIKAEITEKVRFIEQDLFEADISEATVVTLYLLESINIKLRPKLFRELKPGTRIVSHNYSMGEWKPERSTKVNTGGIEHSVFFWVLPSNVSGIWEWTMPAGSNKTSYSLHINQIFQNVDGTMYAGEYIIPIKHISIKGERLKFAVYQEINRQTVLLEFVGIVNGDKVEGSVKSASGSILNSNTWKAMRDPSTVTLIDNSNPDSY